jgi:hypothetical protein
MSIDYGSYGSDQRLPLLNQGKKRGKTHRSKNLLRLILNAHLAR